MCMLNKIIWRSVRRELEEISEEVVDSICGANPTFFLEWLWKITEKLGLRGEFLSSDLFRN
jgi:hypothetical protein